jgi:hypothetical protein
MLINVSETLFKHLNVNFFKKICVINILEIKIFNFWVKYVFSPYKYVNFLF